MKLQPQKTSATCSLVAAFLWSLFPLGLLISGGGATIWFQMIVVSLGFPVWCFVYFRLFFSHINVVEIYKTAFNVIQEHKYSLVVFQAGEMLFLLCVVYGNSTVAVILIETWILSYFVAEFRDSDLGFKYKIGATSLVMLMLIGVAGVIYSQYGSLSLSSSMWTIPATLLAGYLWGKFVQISIYLGKSVKDRTGMSAVAGSMSVIAASRIILLVIFVTIFVIKETIIPSYTFNLSQMFLTIVLWGIVSPFCHLLVRTANINRTEPQILLNVIYYLSIPLAICWLWLAGERINNVPVLVAGGILICGGIFVGLKMSTKS